VSCHLLYSINYNSADSLLLAESGSVLYLGGVDSSVVDGNLNTVPVTQEGYWQVDMDSVNVGGSPAVSSLSAVIDTGTTLVVGDPDSVSQFYENIPNAQDASSSVGDGFYTFPCDSPPQVSLSFGGVAYDVSSTFNLGPASQGSSDCVGGIVGQEIGSKLLSSFCLGD
jgi:cathepsin D